MGRSWRRLRRSLRRVGDGLRRVFSGSSRGSHSRHKLRRSKVKVRSSGPELDFGSGDTWSWSLRIYDDHHLMGVIQAASPLSCMTIVEPFFADGGRPLDQYKVLICCTSTGKKLKVGQRTFAKLKNASEDESAVKLLSFLNEHFDRDLGELTDSSSVTVMIDGEGEIVDSTALLRKVFGQRRETERA